LSVSPAKTREATEQGEAMAGQRPVGVTIVAVLAWISGLFSIIGGVLLLITGMETASQSRTVVVISAIISILIGLVVIIVSRGLFRGAPGARTVVTIVFALNIVNSLVQFFTSTQSLWVALLSALPSIIGIVLLYTQKANAFFGSGTARA
jgi:hypothetical protein